MAWTKKPSSVMSLQALPIMFLILTPKKKLTENYGFLNNIDVSTWALTTRYVQLTLVNLDKRI